MKMKKFFILFAVILPIFCFLSIDQTTPGNLFNCALAEELPAVDVTLFASPETPAVPGTMVTFTASATGGSGEYEYKFLLKGPSTGGEYVTVQDYSISDTWVWSTDSGDLCENKIKVYSRNLGSSSCYEDYAYLNYKVSPQAATDVTLSASPESPSVPGTTVTFSASASGGSDEYEYQFWHKGPSTDNKYELVQDYSTSDTWAWTTDTRDLCNNYVKVKSRSLGSCSSYEAYKYLSYKVSPQAATDVTLSASPESPSVPGTSVTFTASATGGTGEYEYQFWHKGPSTDNKYELVQDYSTSHTWSWTTATGDLCNNYVKVKSRSLGSCSSYEAYKYLSYKVSPQAATDVTLSASSESLSVPGTSVTFTASATGGTGEYEYQFWHKGPSTDNKYELVQDYSTSHTWSWTTATGDFCNNYVKVKSRSLGSCSSYEAYKYLSYKVSPQAATGVTISASPESPSPAGTVVMFTANGSGGAGEYEYQFWHKGPSTGNSWQMVRDYSTTAAWPWTTDNNNIGENYIKVKTRSLGSCSSSEAKAYMNYQITSATGNTSPLAVDDPVTTDEDTPIVAIAVLTNDSDPDGDTVTIDDFTQPTHGTSGSNGDGTLTYTPNTNFNGTDSFTYTVNDGNGGTATATVNIIINPVNDAPVADDQTVTLNEDETASITLTASDADSDTLTYQIVSSPAHGTLTGVAPDITYIPAEDYNGSDTFTFKANDGSIDSNTATVILTIQPVNDAPTAVDDPVTTDEDTPISAIAVLTNDSDPDGDSLSIDDFTQPTHGTAGSNGDGTLTYTSDVNYNGTDSFTYTVNDGNGGTATATVNIIINPVNNETLSITITSPTDGAEFTTGTITVTGTVSRPGAAVFVNGTAATVTGNEFVAQGVSLDPGANNISALAEDGDDTATAGVAVVFVTDIDLEPVRVEISSLVQEDQSLKVSGPVTVTVANNGSGETTIGYNIVVFEDANFTGDYEQTEDNLLGAGIVAAGPGAGEAVDVLIECTGTLSFRDNPIHAFVDSADVVKESREDNNLADTRAFGVDLSASLLHFDDTACPDEVKLTVRLGNAGEYTIPQPISVAFYDGDPQNGGMLIGTVQSAHAILPGHYEDVTFQWQNPASGIKIIYVRADDDGAGTGVLDEADTENNLVFSEMAICTAPAAGPNGISGQVADAVTGAFLSGATVVIHAQETGTIIDQYTTGNYGGFVFSDLQPGNYILKASLQGHINGERGVVLSAGDILTHQDIVLSSELDPEAFRIVLTWGENPADLEAHLTAPNSTGCRHHCYYWNKNITGAGLDLDDRQSYGPETITITQTDPGTYRFYVHDFTNRHSKTGNALSDSGARVTVYSGSGNAPSVFTVPAGAGNVWHIFNLDGTTKMVTPVDKMTFQRDPGKIDFPVITSLPVTSASYSAPYSYQVTVDDPDMDTHAYRLMKSSQGMNIDPVTGLIQWTPTAEQGGSHDIEVRVMDGRCGEDTQLFRVNVTYLPVIQFQVEPCSGFNPGGEITLTWQTERADTVAINQGIGQVPSSGSLTIDSPTEPIAYTLTAANGAGQAQVTSPRPPWATFSAQPNCVPAGGENITLSWTSQCAVTCRIDSVIGPEIGDVPIDGSHIVTPTQIPAGYNLICTNGAGSSSKHVRVNSCPVQPSAHISADPDCDWSPGDPVTLTWSTRSVTSCEIDQGIGSVPLNGSMVVTPTEPTAYTLSASGASASVSIPRRPEIQLFATPWYLDSEESTTLTWNVQCGDTHTLDQGIGDVAATGSLVVTPADLPATYTLTAVNERESFTKSVTVYRRVPTATFSVSPALIKIGESATLTWATDRATACTIEPGVGVVPLSGSITVSPNQNTTYILTVQGQGGTITRTASVAHVRPTAQIQADPEFIDEGETSTLTWVFSNADTCTINQGIGAVQLGGSVTVNPDHDTTYTITATGPGGTATDRVTVFTLKPSVTLTSSAQSILLGESITLAWNAEHASACVITPDIGSVALNGSLTLSPEKATTYTIRATSGVNYATASATVSVTCPPSISILEPDGTGDITENTFTISWTDSDCDDNAAISLYYDTDNAGGDGILIGSGLNEDWDNYSDIFDWNTTQVPEGSYFVYAVINDGNHDPVIDYSEGTVTIDRSRPPLKEIKLTAADGVASDQFGRCVAISGDCAVIGSMGSFDSSQRDVAYVFSKNGDTWEQMARLPIPGMQAKDFFGTSVAISGDYLIIGANESDYYTESSPGGVYIFKREGSDLILQAELTATDPQTVFLGASVAIDGDYAVAGTFGGTYFGMTYPGSAHIFKRDGSTWTETAKLTASDARNGGYFGNSVAISGDYVIVGANTNVYSGNGYEGNGAPAAYIFKREDAVWTQQAKLVSTENKRGFGISVDIHGNSAIVGTTDNTAYIFKRNGNTWTRQAQLDGGDTPAGDKFGRSVAINGDYSISGRGSGSAYIFRRQGDNWLQQRKIIASDAVIGDYFGGFVAMDSGNVIVGAKYDDDNGSQSGSAYIYETCSVEIGADPNVIQAGETATLTWESTNADLVTITPDIGNVAASGNITVAPTQTTTYTIAASGPYGALEKTATVYIGSGPPTASISAVPPTIESGASGTLSWHCTYADTITIEPGIGSVDPDGSMSVSPENTTIYTITATGPEETATARVTITVTHPAPTVSISADPASIISGGSSTLTWTSTNAVTAVIDNNIGSVALNGTISVSPTETTTYTITVTGPGGTTTADVTVTVTLPAPTVSISADPAVILPDESSNLTWISSNADTCVIEPYIGPVELSGSGWVQPPETITYTITATGSGGTATANVTVTVTHPAPTVSISADPAVILPDESSNLTWTSSNADTCVIEPYIGSVELSGSGWVQPPETTTYTITATGSGGTATDSVTVTVTPQITLTITSPNNGSTISRPDVMVQGTITNALGFETGVTVNGIVAMVYGNQFAVNHLPLKEGDNTITAKATDAAGNTAEASVTVTLQPADNYVKITADQQSGVSPLEATLSVEGSFDFTTSSVSYSGPGSVEFLESGAYEYKVRMTSTGIYYFTAEVTDSENNVHTDTVAVVVLDQAQIDQLLKAKWSGMRQALIDGNTESAAAYFKSDRMTAYSEFFQSIPNNQISNVIPGQDKMELVEVLEGIARYVSEIDIVVDGVSTTASSYVIFIKDANGLWKINFF